MERCEIIIATKREFIVKSLFRKLHIYQMFFLYNGIVRKKYIEGYV